MFMLITIILWISAGLWGTVVSLKPKRKKFKDCTLHDLSLDDSADLVIWFIFILLGPVSILFSVLAYLDNFLSKNKDKTLNDLFGDKK